MQVYVPWFFVLSQQRFGVMDIKALGVSQHVTALGSWTNRVIALRQISVTGLFYLEDSRGMHPRSVRACQPKETRREESGGARGGGQGRVRERERAYARRRQRARKRFGSSFCTFFPPPGPALCKLGLARSAVCST